MRIHQCWYCSANIYPGHGMSFVRNDASVFRFCRTKCFKLFKRRINPRKVKWTKLSRQIRGKELTDDPILAFERRVHRPIIYDRETVQSTVATLPKILALKQHRENILTKNRILSKYEEQKERDIAFINKYEWLLHKNQEKTTELTTKLLKSKKTETEFN